MRKRHVEDEVANALYNIADGLRDVAKAIGGLIYGLKYGPDQAKGGRSIAESIEVGLDFVAAGGTVKIHGKTNRYADGPEGRTCRVIYGQQCAPAHRWEFGAFLFEGGWWRPL